MLLLVADELSSTHGDHRRRCHALSSVVIVAGNKGDHHHHRVVVGVQQRAQPRPLLREFGRGISRRVRISEGGSNHAGQGRAYTSEEIIPCLDMRSSAGSSPMGGRRRNPVHKYISM